MKKLSAFAVIFAILGAAFFANAQMSHPEGQEDRSYVIFTQQKDSLLVSYFFNEKGVVFNKMEDPLRAGQTLKVRHELTLTAPKNKWWNLGGKSWSASYVRFLSYDPLNDSFSLVDEGGKSRVELSAEKASKIAFSGYKVNLMNQLDQLEVGQTYELNVKVRFEPLSHESSWLKYFSLSGFWEPQTMEASVEYIVPKTPTED